MRLALHACCGPCLIEPLDALVGEADETVVVFANPNIQPFAEYELRLQTLREYAEERGLEVIELEYDLARWLAEVGVHGADANARCRSCYRLRLSMVADWAAEHGFDTVSTTLTVSPYQDSAVIAIEGQGATSRAGVAWLTRDFRDRYPDATRRSRDLGMYRQNYCGCVMSDLEARASREERRAARRQSKLAHAVDDASV